VLVGQAQVSWHCFTGDSTQFFLDNIISQKALDPALSKLPFVSQHYDELMFVYPLVFAEKTQAIPLFAIWLNSGAAKVSVIFTLFLVLRRFAVSIPLSITFCLYILVGTWALSPFKYFIFFDSGTPHIFNLGGMGRILSTVLPWFLFFHFSSVAPGNRTSPMELTILGIGTLLFGMGITATSIHNAVYALGFTSLYLIYRQLWTGSGETLIHTVRIPVFREVAVISIVGMLGAYSFGATPFPTLGGGFFFIFLVYAGIILSGTLMKDGLSVFSKGNFPSRDVSAYILVGTFLFGIFGGLAFGGNIIFGALYPKLATMFPGDALPVMIERISGIPHAIFKMFSAPDYLAQSPHYNHIGPYDSLISFLEYFGPMLFAAAAIMYWSERKIQKQDISTIHIPKLFIFVILSASLFLFAASNFLKDFIQYIFEPHHLTRLLEYPFYAIMTAFVIMASHYLQGRNRVAFTLLAILWILIPLANHPTLQQWQINTVRMFG
jgi:hypothetical protein